MSKIPTAEEFVMRGHLWVGDDEDVNDLAKSHIEFARLHVEAALKEAKNFLKDGYVTPQDEQDILNAYPLTNIK